MQVKATVPIMTVTRVQACIVRISHSWSRLMSSLCSLLNKTCAMNRSLFQWLMKYDGTIFCAHCIHLRYLDLSNAINFDNLKKITFSLFVSHYLYR